MNLNDAWGQFFYAVRTSGRPRAVRWPGMSDEDYYLAELTAGTPDELARRLAGLPPLSPDNGE
ncbi:hypothetical protein [Micromonospora arida]|uniref:hypothetical protein n=1 Tax=Micromonospora arida TaxID=2203715 RepID=UPI000F6029A9|nr:hypothetical protein [Micromonospora arida]